MFVLWSRRFGVVWNNDVLENIGASSWYHRLYRFLEMKEIRTVITCATHSMKHTAHLRDYCVLVTTFNARAEMGICIFWNYYWVEINISGYYSQNFITQWFLKNYLLLLMLKTNNTLNRLVTNFCIIVLTS